MMDILYRKKFIQKQMFKHIFLCRRTSPHSKRLLSELSSVHHIFLCNQFYVELSDNSYYFNFQLFFQSENFTTADSTTPESTHNAGDFCIKFKFIWGHIRLSESRKRYLAFLRITTNLSQICERF